MTCWLCGFKTSLPGPGCKNGGCQICTKIAMVDEEIIQVAATLRHLLTKRCDLRSQHNRAHDAMRRLPLELKNRIFALVLPTRDKWGAIVRSRRQRLEGKPPSYLTSICKDWRDIAWSNPFLWSTVPIVLGTPSTSDSTWVDCVYDWIQRSGTLPLTFHITVYEDPLENDSKICDLEEQLNVVLAVMSRCSNEWQSLSIDAPGFLLHTLQSGENEFKSRLRTVRRLRLICDTDDCGGDDVPPTMNPETIEISYLPFKSLPTSWTNLTSAGISYWDLEDVVLLFQHASLLTCCSIWWPLSCSTTMPPITHHKLQSLTFHSHPSQDVASKLINSLTLPCLRTTEIDAIAVTLLPSLMHRSSCPLSRVKLGRMKVLPSKAGLRPLPGVTDLVLEDDVRNDAKLKELLLGGYFPDLRYLTLPLESFWESDTISTLLNYNRPQPDALSDMTLHTILVVGVEADMWFRKVDMWNLEFGKQLKACHEWTVNLREGGFELLYRKPNDSRKFG